MRKIKIFLMSFIVVFNVSAEEKDCAAPMLEIGKKIAIKTFISEKRSQLENLVYEKLPFDGFEFADCCWSRQVFRITDKVFNESLEYVLSAGNSYGEYQKGNCQLTINKRNIILPDVKREAAQCLHLAKEWAESNIDKLVIVEADKQQFSEKFFAYSLFVDGQPKGKLNLSILECQFSGYSL